MVDDYRRSGEREPANDNHPLGDGLACRKTVPAMMTNICSRGSVFRLKDRDGSSI